jgi:hypothetical protein
MKKASVSVIVSILAIVLLMGTALAAPSDLPGSGWWSGETIQNVGTDQAQIDITAYDSASSNTYSTSDTIDSGANKTYLPNSFTGMPAGFQGSAVVSSNSDIRAIVNITNRYATIGSDTFGDPSTPSAAAGQYQGINEPDTTLVFPLIKNNSFTKTTSLYVQNAGSAAATAQVVFYMAAGTYTYTTPSISPGAMAVVNPSVTGMPDGNTAKGSAVVSSAQPLAGTSLEYIQGEANATVVQATRGFTPADYDTKLYAPTNKNNRAGRFTGLQVQNVSSGAIDVTVNYVGVGGTCVGKTFSDSHSGLAAGASWTFPASALDDNCNASATVTGTGDIVGIVNESYTSAFLISNPTRHQEATVYFGSPAGKASDFISLPLFKEDANSKGTGLSVQNVGSGDAHVTLTFANSVGTFTTVVQTIGAGSAQVFLDVRNQPASFWNGTAMTPALLGCTNSTSGCGAKGNFAVLVSSDQPVVAIANESTYPVTAPRISQDKSNYEGFNLSALP